MGFNLLQKVEQQLFSELQKAGTAHFYWDFDDYYMQGHEAGHYIAQYLHAFPNELDSSADDIYKNFKKPKDITYISAPTEHIQARYVSSWLNQQRIAKGRRTAIVLCNENLLPTVIHSLPDEVEKVNITTGYPLSQTPIASFIQCYYDMVLGGKTPRLVRAFRRHPYYRYLTDDSQPLLHLLRQLIEIDKALAPFTILGLEHDVKRELSLQTSSQRHTLKERTIGPLKIGGRIDRLDQLSDGRIRVVDYKTGSQRLKALSSVEDIFDPAKIHDHSDYYFQTFVYADIVRRQQSHPVSPALLFIQHAASKDYDPTLCFGKERILDIADYSARFNELLEQKVNEIFSSEIPFTPTTDLKICRTCPYLQMCRR